MEQFELIAKTFQGLEEVLAQELTELGADEIQIGRRMVSFTGNKEMMYRANFCLRTAVMPTTFTPPYAPLIGHSISTSTRPSPWTPWFIPQSSATRNS